MATAKETLMQKSWTRDDVRISINPPISIDKIISIFDSEELYWAKSMPAKEMKEMLDNSMYFVLYRNSSTSESSQQDELTQQGEIPPDDMLGFARSITDFTTFAYLTDVWVDPKQQGRGLGKWLVACVGETFDSMPYLRRSVLFTGDWERSVPFYEKIMGMKLIKSEKGKGLAVMQKKGGGNVV